MSTHTVKKGECLASITRTNKFNNWRSIYYDPQNAGLRQKRPNPNLLSSGDEIFIPEPQKKIEKRTTGNKHTFILNFLPSYLRIVLQKEDGAVLANCRYRLRLKDQIIEGVTDSNGLLEHQIDPLLEDGELTVEYQEGASRQSFTWILEIGYLEPVEELRGIQSRLNNLGFDSGPQDGKLGEWTRSAIEAFQKAYGLKMDGIAGRQTKAKLSEVYGC